MRFGDNQQFVAAYEQPLNGGQTYFQTSWGYIVRRRKHDPAGSAFAHGARPINRRLFIFPRRGGPALETYGDRLRITIMAIVRASNDAVGGLRRPLSRAEYCWRQRIHGDDDSRPLTGIVLAGGNLIRRRSFCSVCVNHPWTEGFGSSGRGRVSTAGWGTNAGRTS
jgi:hypothetical protein